VVLAYDGETDPQGFSVMIHNRVSNEKTFLQYDNALVDPLTYPLLFPYGTMGFHQHIPHVRTDDRARRSDTDDTTGDTGREVTILQFYKFMLQRRDARTNTFLFTGKLHLQYVLDAWMRCINER
jgi:hypothetical protein